MILKILIFCGCFLCISAQGNKGACLSGYMADPGRWVDHQGQLLVEKGNIHESIDLSMSDNPVSLLQDKMSPSRRSSQPPVKYLSMARCKLSRVPPIFHYTDSQNQPLASTLVYLTLYGNSFVSMSTPGEHYTISFNATGSTVMNLSNAPQRLIASIWSAGLSTVKFPNLSELDLRSCSIQFLGPNLFNGMTALTALYIGDNDINYIDSTAFIGLSNLLHLNFSKNHVFDEDGIPKSLGTEFNHAFKHLNSLTSLDLSYTKLTDRSLGIIRNVAKSLKSLSLCFTGLNSLGKDIFKDSAIEVLDLSRNNGILNTPNPLKGLEQSLLVLAAEETSLTKIEVVENFSKLLILQLANNEINNLSDSTMQTLQDLRILDLYKNRINSWFDLTFSLMPKLQFLSLRNNNINIITEEMIHDLMFVDYVSISENYLICHCHAKDLYKMAAKNDKIYIDTLIKMPGNFRYNISMIYNTLIENRNKIELNDCDDQCMSDIGFSGKFRFVDYTPDSYVCMTLPESRTEFISDVYSCGRVAREITYDQELKIGMNKLMVLWVIPCLLLPAALIFVFRRHVRYFYITMRNSAMLSIINKKDAIDDTTIFNYDVFVSYCNEDRGWVLDHLLPHMETECSISACLHERDFQVGLSILENIVSCMDRSRSIMLILSKQFLLSQWCQFEMHLAQHRLLETRREDLTLILLEDIPRRLRPNTLHYLMLTKTYIIWPKDESERPNFWKRLKKTLIAQKNKPAENVSLA